MMRFRGALLKPSEKPSARAVKLPRGIPAQSRYEVLKGQVRDWWEDRFKVGEALKEIRESKLYRHEYENFEEFTEAEFGIKRTYAHRLIEAAEIKESVKMLPIGNKIVSHTLHSSPSIADTIVNEAQARALAAVPVEQREEVLTQVSEAGPVTAKAITETAKAISAPAPSSKPEKVVHLDKTGYAIPEEVWDDWQRAEAFRANLNELSRIKSEITAGLNDKDVIFREINSSAVSMLENLYAELKCVVPYAVCTSCQGRTRKNCTLCRQRGFLSQFAYNQFVPAETRAIREKVGKK